MTKNQLRPAASAFVLMLTMSLLSTALSFFVAPVWGMVYDFSGSYQPALLAMPVLLVGGIFCLIGAFRKIEA